MKSRAWGVLSHLTIIPGLFLLVFFARGLLSLGISMLLLLLSDLILLLIGIFLYETGEPPKSSSSSSSDIPPEIDINITKGNVVVQRLIGLPNIFISLDDDKFEKKMQRLERIFKVLPKM